MKTSSVCAEEKSNTFKFLSPTTPRITHAPKRFFAHRTTPQNEARKQTKKAELLKPKKKKSKISNRTGT